VCFRGRAAAQTCLEAFACVKIGAQSYIASATEEACSGAAYSAWAAFVAVLLVIVGAAVFVAMPGYLIWQYRKGHIEVRSQRFSWPDLWLVSVSTLTRVQCGAGFVAAASVRPDH
jgi:hypothetical protein